MRSRLRRKHFAFARKCVRNFLNYLTFVNVRASVSCYRVTRKMGPYFHSSCLFRWVLGLRFTKLHRGAPKPVTRRVLQPVAGGFRLKSVNNLENVKHRNDYYSLMTIHSPSPPPRESDINSIHLIFTIVRIGRELYKLIKIDVGTNL